MSLRIIAGTARGRKLLVPESNVRPTLDRVRQAAFNILQQEIPGCRFLDLFAGSGANGIEALSRGARRAVLTDSSKACLRIIERNLNTAGLRENATVLQAEAPRDLAKLSPLGPFDVIYLDPPHDFEGMDEVARAIHALQLLASGGTVVWEHASHGISPEALPALTHTRTTRYGGTSLSLYS